MNLRRGLIRTWIVLSLFWVVGMANNNFPPDVNLRDWWTDLWLFVMPPVCFAIVLAAIGWIIVGFRGDPSK